MNSFLIDHCQIPYPAFQLLFSYVKSQVCISRVMVRDLCPNNSLTLSKSIPAITENLSFPHTRVNDYQYDGFQVWRATIQSNCNSSTVNPTFSQFAEKRSFLGIHRPGTLDFTGVFSKRAVVPTF